MTKDIGKRDRKDGRGKEQAATTIERKTGRKQRKRANRENQGQGRKKIQQGLHEEKDRKKEVRKI